MTEYKYCALNADLEIPNCGLCDNQKMSEEFCKENCGPEHWWKAYKRSVVLEDV